MRTYLRTRGRVRDYQFIGLAPEDMWWRSYAEVTDLETPAVLVESGGQSWRAYVSGIRSGRKDRVGRPIVMDLVLDGEQATQAPGDHELALAIIAAGLGLTDGDSLGPERLDTVITEEAVEEWLAEPTLSAWQQAAAAIATIFRDVHPTLAADSVPSPNCWVGGLDSARSRAAFLALAGRLLSGAKGRALTLSYIADPSNVHDIPGGPGDDELGVLAASHGPLSRADPMQIVR
jgi:hypothetical protein